VWSLGILFYCLVHGVFPWGFKKRISSKDYLELVKTAPFNIRNDLSSNAKNFILWRLRYNESERLTWEMVTRH